MKHESNIDGEKMGWRSIGVMARKWTGFSRIEIALTRHFPHKSTQVVDFPHKATVRLFWEQGFYRRDAETQRQAKLATNMWKPKKQQGAEPRGGRRQDGQ
jgi:hypothetical protein